MPDTVWQEMAAEAGHPTHNPDGVTTSNYEYWPRTQEEKAEALGMPFATIVDIDIEAPYPEGSPLDEVEAFDQLARIRSPHDLVPSDESKSAAEKNLAAGGSMELDDVRALRTSL